MQSIDEVDESCAWSPSSISHLSPPFPSRRLSQPARSLLPSLSAALRALAVPLAPRPHRPTDPPTHTHTTPKDEHQRDLQQSAPI